MTRSRPAPALALWLLPRVVPLLVALVQLLGCEGVARADIEPIRIEYKAPTGCPSASQFQRQVFARTTAARLAGPNETARAFSVELERKGARVVGSLTVYEPDGVSNARTFAGSQCRQVALVLALATALAIDPRAELTPHEEPGIEPGAEPGEEPGLGDEPGDPIRDGASPSEVSSGSGSGPPASKPVVNDGGTSGPIDPEVIDPPDLRLPPEPPPRHAFGVALGPRVAAGTTPRVAFGPALQLTAYTRGVVSSLGVELAWLGTQTEHISGAGADFTFLLARPQFCMSNTALSARVGLRPCFSGEFGSVTGMGSALPRETTAQRFWAALEVVMRMDIELSDPWFLGLDAGVAVPLSRYRFVFETPVTSIYDVAPITPVAALTLGLRY